MNSHPKIAEYLLTLLSSQGMNCPVSEVENFVEVKQWLGSIKDGNLLVTQKPEPDPNGNGA